MLSSNLMLQINDWFPISGIRLWWLCVGRYPKPSYLCWYCEQKQKKPNKTKCWISASLLVTVGMFSTWFSFLLANFTPLAVCLLHFLLCQYFCVTVGWTQLQLTCLPEWKSRILDVLLIKCISLQCFLAGLYLAIYSSAYHTCHTPSSSSPGSRSVFPLTLSPLPPHLCVHFSLSQCLPSFSSFVSDSNL